MHRKYGVGPGSLFVEAVSVTLAPTAAVVALAVSVAVHPFVAYVGVHRSPGPVPLVPLLVVAVTWTVVVPEGATAVADVAELTVTLLAGVLPNRICVVLSKPVPVSVTVVPPAEGPEEGLIAATVGAAGSADGVGEGDADPWQLRLPGSRRMPSVPTKA